MKIIFSLTLVFFSLSLFGQIEKKHLAVKNACFYSGEALPKQLFILPTDTIKGLCEDILKATGTEQNFQILAANVPSATAIIDSNGIRYLLYSRKHFITNEDQAYQITVLAHEIAHHANKHTLQSERRETEEIEADEFTGFALYRMGVLRHSMDKVIPSPQNLPCPPYCKGEELNIDEKKQAILRGFNRGEASVIVSPHAAFEDDGSGNSIPGIPEFPFPPPEPSASYQLYPYFTGSKNLFDVEQKLRQALEACGYYEKRYFYVKNGFALITRIEQMQENGTPLMENRWNPKPIREESFSLSGFISALFTSKPGYFRVFVFIATDEPFVTSTDRKITRDDAMAWLNQGCFKLPQQIGQIKFSANTSVVALVYEFQITEADRNKAKQSKPSALDCETHLRSSKILTALK